MWKSNTYTLANILLQSGKMHCACSSWSSYDLTVQFCNIHSSTGTTHRLALKHYLVAFFRAYFASAVCILGTYLLYTCMFNAAVTK